MRKRKILFENILAKEVAGLFWISIGFAWLYIIKKYILLLYLLFSCATIGKNICEIEILGGI